MFVWHRMAQSDATRRNAACVDGMVFCKYKLWKGHFRAILKAPGKKAKKGFHRNWEKKIFAFPKKGLKVFPGRPAVQKRSMMEKMAIFFVPCYLEIWRITLKSIGTPPLCYIKLCTSFRSHLRIQTGVTARKLVHWGKNCFDLCDLDLWTWPFAWASLLSMVIYEDRNTVKKGVTDGRTEVFLELLGRS